MMKYFYSSACMGFYGQGYFWHKILKFFTGKDFPKFPAVCKTITRLSIKATPWRVAYLPFMKSMWNRVGLHNKGFDWWCRKLTLLNVAAKLPKPLIPSLAGSDEDIQWMIDEIVEKEGKALFKMIEINISCPNVTGHSNKRIPDSPIPLSLKVGYNFDFTTFKDLKNIKRMVLNSIPATDFGKIGKFTKGAVSGKLAQSKNWGFIAKHVKELKRLGISLAGCSVTSKDDIDDLKKMGCTEIALCSVLAINPSLVQGLKK